MSRACSGRFLVGLIFWCIVAPIAGCAVPREVLTPTPTAASTPLPEIREAVRIESLSFPGSLWSPLLPPLSEGTPTTISARLTIPASAEPVPAAVITHGCSGIGPSERGWAQQLQRLGIATLVVQSFGDRSIPELCSGRHTINIASVLVDAYRALDLLAGHPRIDSSRIAILGFSFGGRTALWTSQERIHARYGIPGRTFAAHLAFYPTGCFMQLAEEDQITGSPIRIFHGEADDWTPIEQCRRYVERLQLAGADAVLFAYAEALHSFDNGYIGAVRIPDAVSPRNCSFVEQDGVLIDQDTGNEATLASGCVTRGVTVAYNAAAHGQAIRDVEDVLRTIFALP